MVWAIYIYMHIYIYIYIIYSIFSLINAKKYHRFKDSHPRIALLKRTYKKPRFNSPFHLFALFTRTPRIIIFIPSLIYINNLMFLKYDIIDDWLNYTASFAYINIFHINNILQFFLFLFIISQHVIIFENIGKAVIRSMKNLNFTSHLIACIINRTYFYNFCFYWFLDCLSELRIHVVRLSQNTVIR